MMDLLQDVTNLLFRFAPLLLGGLVLILVLSLTPGLRGPRRTRKQDKRL